MRQCPNCKVWIHEKLKVCFSCGKRLENEDLREWYGKNAD